MKKISKDELSELVYNTKTEYQYGFTSDELIKLKNKFPDINEKNFINAMMGNTCMVIDGNIINYHCDVVTALICGIENREMRFDEWD